mgnify:CR=1 FL=1
MGLVPVNTRHTPFYVVTAKLVLECMHAFQVRSGLDLAVCKLKIKSGAGLDGVEQLS